MFRNQRNNNRLLIESGEISEEEKEDPFLRQGSYREPMMGAGMPQRRNLPPLIQEEDNAPQSNSALSDKGKANLAAYMFHQNKVRAQRFADAKAAVPRNMRKMFGADHPAQVANANRPGGFQKLFGAKMSDEEIVARDVRRGESPKSTFWGRLKNAVTGGGRKRSWMEMLFGARKKSRNLEVEEKNAIAASKKGRSWADALAPLDGDQDAGVGGGGGGGAQLLSENGDEEKSFEAYDPDNDDAKGGGTKAITNVKDLNAQLAIMQQLNQNAGAQEKDPHATVDDNSIDNDDEEDKNPVYDERIEKIKGLMARKHNDDDSDEEPEEQEGLNSNPMFQQFLLAQLGQRGDDD